MKHAYLRGNREVLSHGVVDANLAGRSERRLKQSTLALLVADLQGGHDVVALTNTEILLNRACLVVALLGAVGFLSTNAVAVAFLRRRAFVVNKPLTVRKAVRLAGCPINRLKSTETDAAVNSSQVLSVEADTSTCR